MKRPEEVPRRDFFKGVGAASAALSLASETAAAQDEPVSAQVGLPSTRIRLSINRREKTFSVDNRTTLVDLLRENEHLTGTKKGCDHGACGACTVHVNGRRVLACLTLAVTIDAAEVQTIEGVSRADDLHPMQEAFLRCDAYQCGYCTPGQIMSAIACVGEGHADDTASAEETREWMSGNLCRCSAYPNITEAVRQVSGAVPVQDPASRVTKASAADKSEMSS